MNPTFKPVENELRMKPRSRNSRSFRFKWKRWRNTKSLNQSNIQGLRWKCFDRNDFELIRVSIQWELRWKMKRWQKWNEKYSRWKIENSNCLIDWRTVSKLSKKSLNDSRRLSLRAQMLIINGKQNSMKLRVKDTLIFKSQSPIVNQSQEAMGKEMKNSLKNKSRRR